jgi:hypothetical protein
LHPVDQVIHLHRGPVELDDQERRCIQWIACRHEFFDRMYRRPVHHFHAAWNDAGRNDICDALARRLV